MAPWQIIGLLLAGGIIGASLAAVIMAALIGASAADDMAEQPTAEQLEEARHQGYQAGLDACTTLVESARQQWEQQRHHELKQIGEEIDDAMRQTLVLADLLDEQAMSKELARIGVVS